MDVQYFCIAPGSRSSPLAAAAAANPRVTVTSCIDERSLAFHALGYGRGANKPAAVITSSGTAVSNLFPAVIDSFRTHLLNLRFHINLFLFRSLFCFSSVT